MYSVETTPDVRTAALRIAQLGLRVHPLIGKRPIWEDWPTRATADQEVVAAWLSVPGRNYGIVCDQIAVIDTDSEALSTWWTQHMTPTPWSVRTPRGGRHFYYRSRPGLRNAVKAHRGWDIRAGGRGYIVGAGSVGRGRRYELVGRVTLDLPPFESEWLPAPVPEPAGLPQTPGIARGQIRDLAAYLRRIPSIQGARGSDACFRVACILRDEGQSPAEALAIMQQWNEQCAAPAWSVPELEKKIRDAYSKLAKGG